MVALPLSFIVKAAINESDRGSSSVGHCSDSLSLSRVVYTTVYAVRRTHLLAHTKS